MLKIDIDNTNAKQNLADFQQALARIGGRMMPMLCHDEVEIQCLPGTEDNVYLLALDYGIADRNRPGFTRSTR